MTEVEFVASISALLHQQSTESSLGSIDDEQMTTDVDLLVVTENSEVVVSLSNPILHLALNVEISDFVLRGMLLVVLKPLFPLWPTFGAVAVSFIEKPAPAGDAVYEPNGAASTLNDSSQDTERSCGAPLLVANKVLIPFSMLLSGVLEIAAPSSKCHGIHSLDKEVRNKKRRLLFPTTSLGRGLFSEAVACERLASMDVNRTLDPYVVFSVGCRTKQSTVKRHTFNPIWDPPESFELLVADYQHDEMSVLVMDSNLLKTDDTVSRVQIGLEPVQRLIG
ncbi:C2 domain [Phytophthora cactorum]|nr:C2 domain [Phytophthora cactorum]